MIRNEYKNVKKMEIIYGNYLQKQKMDLKDPF